MPRETREYADKVLAARDGNGRRVDELDPGAAGRRAESGKPAAVNVHNTLDITLRDPQQRPVAPVAVVGSRIPVPVGG